MSIQKNFAGGNGSYIQAPGEYKVIVKEAKTGKSKKGVDQLIVTLATDDGRTINHYFSSGQEIATEHLARFREAAGIPAGEKKLGAFVGKRLGIAVGPGKPLPDGKVFMRVEGVGKESEVDEFGGGFSDQVPF